MEMTTGALNPVHVDHGKQISIFDFDSTLVSPPLFVTFLSFDSNGIVAIEGEYADYLNKIKSFFFIVFSKEIYFVVKETHLIIYDAQKKAPLESKYADFIIDMEPDKMVDFSLKSRDLKWIKRLLKNTQHGIEVEPPPGYYDSAKTIGHDIKPDVVRKYEEAKNKMIVTGRNEELRKELEGRLEKLGITYPNYGLYMYPGPGKNSGIKQYKVDVILDIIEKNGFETIQFYEDNLEWLNAVKAAALIRFPNLSFFAHHVS